MDVHPPDEQRSRISRAIDSAANNATGGGIADCPCGRPSERFSVNSLFGGFVRERLKVWPVRDDPTILSFRWRVVGSNDSNHQQRMGLFEDIGDDPFKSFIAPEQSDWNRRIWRVGFHHPE